MLHLCGTTPRFGVRGPTIGERPDLEGAISGCGSYIAAQNLAVYHQNLGDPKVAAEFAALAERLRKEALEPAAPAAPKP